MEITFTAQQARALALASLSNPVLTERFDEVMNEIIAAANKGRQHLVWVSATHEYSPAANDFIKSKLETLGYLVAYSYPNPRITIQW